MTTRTPTDKPLLQKVDVTPIVTADGVVASLIGLAEPDRIKQSDKAPSSIGDNTNFELNASKASIDVVASMGFGSMVDVNASSEAVFFVVEISNNEQKISRTDDSIIAAEYYGVTIRICVKAWKIDASATADLGVVASSASAASASVSYQVDVVGINAYELSSLPGLISGSIGPFDVSKLQTIGAVVTDLGTFVSEHPDKCRPELLAVDVDLKKINMPYADTSSGVFGLGRIAAGLAYNDAIMQKPPSSDNYPDVTDALVENLYEAIVKTLLEPPNVDQAKSAGDALKAGERPT